MSISCLWVVIFRLPAAIWYYGVGGTMDVEYGYLLLWIAVVFWWVHGARYYGYGGELPRCLARHVGCKPTAVAHAYGVYSTLVYA